MVLTDNEMAMAKELARELSLTGMEERKALDTVKAVFNAIRDEVLRVWKALEGVVSTITDKCIDTTERPEWHVPIKITPPPMPDIKLPKMQLARSKL